MVEFAAAAAHGTAAAGDDAVADKTSRASLSESNKSCTRKLSLSLTLQNRTKGNRDFRKGEIVGAAGTHLVWREAPSKNYGPVPFVGRTEAETEPLCFSTSLS